MREEPTYEELVLRVKALEQEVSRRNRNGEAAEKNEERYRAVLDSVDEGYFEVDLTGRFVFFNDWMCRIAGDSREELLKMTNRDYMTPESAERVYRTFSRIFETGEPAKGVEHEIITTKGDRRFHELSASLMRDEGGQPIGFRGIVHDITDRKEAEQELRLSEQRLALIFDSVVDVLFYIGVEPDGCLRFLSINKAFLDVTGLAEDQIVGKRMEEVIPEPSVRLVLGNYRKAIQEKRVVMWEETSVYPAGKKTGVVSVAPLLNEEGICTHLVGSVHDITENKRREEAFQKSQDELRRLSARMLEVQEDERKRIARELHDNIGQSLTAMKFGLERALEAIRQGATEAAFELLESLVTTSQSVKEEVGRTQMELRPSLLDDLGIVSTISWFCREFNRIYSHIRIETKIDIEEGAVAQPLKVVIFRVLQEAMNNVAKHSQTETAIISLRKMDGQIEFVIRDEGQGFNVEQVRSERTLSERFGLASMKERIELSGGSFAIESVPGSGTAVRAVW